MKNNSHRKIRILLADDHLVVRVGLASVFSFERDLAVVGEAATGEEAVRLAKELKPDVVVMDLMMPKLNGAQATAALTRHDTGIRVLILTSFGSSHELSEAIAVGAAGALLKTAEKEEMLQAIRIIAAGGTYTGKGLCSVAHPESDQTPLSSRQIEILGLVAKGYTNQEIAELLKISIDTVKTHLKSIFIRLGTSSRTEAATIAGNKGII